MKSYLKFLLPSIGTDESRHSLMFLQIKVIDNKAIMIAANANSIKQVEMGCAIDDGEYFVSGSDVRGILKLCTKGKVITLAQEGLRIGNILFEWSPESGNITFPNSSFEKVMKGDYGSHSQSIIGLNANILATMLSGAPSEVVKVDFKETSELSCVSPVRITFYDCPEYKAFILPVKINW